MFRVLRYIESDYAHCSFSKITEQLHYDPSWLSREIKRTTGKTFTQLVQEKRLAQALTETLTAVFFIIEHVQKAGYQVSTMSNAARNFISNWESEKYRSSLNEKR